MNMREGMRRVGIALGVLEFVAGGVFGYWNLQDAWSSHTKFERLQALPVMREVNADIESLSFKGHGKTPGGVDLEDPDKFMMRERNKNHGETPTRAEPPETISVTDFENWRKQEAEKVRDSGFSISSPNGIVYWSVSGPDGSIEDIWVDVDGIEGIQTVRADKTGTVSSIQLTTGEWVHMGSKTLKARLAFVASLLLPFCYPVIGFLVPWGSIKALVWVGTGFVAPRGSA